MLWFGIQTRIRSELRTVKVPKYVESVPHSKYRDVCLLYFLQQMIESELDEKARKKSVPVFYLHGQGHSQNRSVRG